jgi:hypothetical protein
MCLCTICFLSGGHLFKFGYLRHQTTWRIWTSAIHEMKKNSLTDPLRLAAVSAGSELARIGITFWPGKYDPHGGMYEGQVWWDRDLADDYMSRVVYCEGAFYVYRDAHWCALSDHQLANTIYRYNTLRFRPGSGGIVKLNKGRTESVLSVMRNRAANDGFFRDAPAGINCTSGFIQFDAGGNATLAPHDRDFRQRHCLPGSWQPSTWKDVPLLDRLLEGCFGQDTDFAEKISLIGEMCGVAAVRYTELAPTRFKEFWR